MRLKTLLFPLFMSGLFISQMASANEMKKVFDYYAQGTPGTYSSERMKHWMGASFSGRNALNEPDLIQAPTINMSGSCKGLDFHASGFGLVTKDEIVQMARGIAQGAPGYFFNMAIGAVCSSCLQNINEFMRKLEQFNQLTKNSCEKFWDKASDLAGLPTERVRANAASKGKLKDEKDGVLSTWGASLDEYFAKAEAGLSVDGLSNSNAEAVLNENVVFGRIKDVFQTTVITNMFPDSDISTPEMAMSLFGTIITVVKPDETQDVVLDKRFKATNLNPHNLVFKSEAAGGNVHFYKCDDRDEPAAMQQCLNPVSVEDDDFVGLYALFLVKLNGEGANQGIIDKIAHRQNIDAQELEFIKAFEMPYIKIAQLESSALRKQMGERFAYVLARNFVNDLYRETSNVVTKAFRAQSQNTTPVDYSKEIKEFVSESNLELDKLNETISIKIDEIDKTLTTVAAIKSLFEDNVGVRN